MLWVLSLIFWKKQNIQKKLTIGDGIEIMCEIDTNYNRISFLSNPEDVKLNNMLSGTLFIPDEIKVGKKMMTFVKLGEYSFANTELTEIHLPSTIFSIGKGAFSNSKKLKKVNLSECNVKMLNEKMFYNCYSLSEIILPKILTIIGDLCFFSTSITSFTIPDNLKHINFGVFSNCTSLKSIEVNNNNRFFGFNGVFLFRKGKGTVIFALPQIDEINIPANIIYIGRYSFAFSQIKHIFIPKQIVEIQEYAFSNCSQLSSIEFSQGSLVEIGKSAFSGARIMRLILPKSLKTVMGRAFSMSSLRAVDLSDTQVTTIQSYTFDGCSSLVVVALPNCLTSIEHSAFTGSSVEKIIYCGEHQFDVEFIKNGAFLVCEKMVGLDEL